MITQYHKIVLAAGIVLAMAFTFSCSSDDKSDDGGGGSGTGNGGVGGSSSSRLGSSSSARGSSSSGGSCPIGIGGTFIDERDNKSYKWVKICEQTWMAENLNYAVEGSKCGDRGDYSYGDIYRGSTLIDINTTYCDAYGRLYGWGTAMALPSKCNSILSENDTDCVPKTTYHKGICFSGWHIPSDNEWNVLFASVGGYITAGDRLKATSGWYGNRYGDGNGTDDYGFAALPGGYGRIYPYNDFMGAGEEGKWWRTTSSHENGYLTYDMRYEYRVISMSTYSFDYDHYDNLLFSVRCLKD